MDAGGVGEDDAFARSDVDKRAASDDFVGVGGGRVGLRRVGLRQHDTQHGERFVGCARRADGVGDEPIADDAGGIGAQRPRDIAFLGQIEAGAGL